RHLQIGRAWKSGKIGDELGIALGVAFDQKSPPAFRPEWIDVRGFSEMVGAELNAGLGFDADGVEDGGNHAVLSVLRVDRCLAIRKPNGHGVPPCYISLRASGFDPFFDLRATGWCSGERHASARQLASTWWRDTPTFLSGLEA